MKALDVMKRSLSTALSSRRLWLFGFFVAATSSGSGGGGGGGGGGAPSGDLPSWLLPVLVGGAVVALAGLAMHVISEAALIDGVGSGRPKAYRIREGFEIGRRSFFRVLGLKTLLALVATVTLAVVAAPAALGAAGAIPLPVGLAATLPLALLALPWALTIYFLYEYALRFVVLDGAGALEAIRLAEDHLHGRVGDSLRLLGVSLLGMPASGAAVGAAALPCAALGGLVHLAAGPVAGVVVGLALLLPCVLCILGALGTYRSAVWTLAFVDGEGEAA